MPNVDLVSNLRTALQRRNVTLAAAANMCSSDPEEVQAILRGCGSNPNARDIQAIAAAVASVSNDPDDRNRFLCEIFEIGSHAPGGFAPIVPPEFERRVVLFDRAPVTRPLAIWFDALGHAVENPKPNLTALAYETLNMQPGRENIIGFACSNLGYVGLSLDAAGTLRVYYDHNVATLRPLSNTYEWMRENAQKFRRVIRTQMNCPGGVGNQRHDSVAFPSESPNEAMVSLERLVTSVTPLTPDDWLVDRRSIDETPKSLLATLRLSMAGSSPMAALAAANRLRAAHVYAIVDGGAVALQMSNIHSLPTSRYVGTPVLSRPTERDYAALVDKHITESFRDNSATLYKLGVTIAGKQRDYWRLALPDRDSGIVVSAPWEPAAEEEIAFA
jgi:hypothetical protein